MSIVVLLSGNGSNLQAIIDAGIPIAAVISNRPDAYGIKRAHAANIPTHVIDHKKMDSRHAFDQALQAQINQYQPTLVVLAGFMLILSESFVTHFHGQLINIHPSLLPKHKGLNTHQKVLAAKEIEHGISIHYVTAELDGGPIIAQSKLDVLENDSEATLEARIHALEHKLYPCIIKKIKDGHISLISDRVVFEGNPLAKSGIMLNL